MPISVITLGRWAYLLRAEADVPFLRRELTIASKYGGESVELFDDSLPAYFGLPLYHPSLPAGADIIDRRVTTVPIHLRFTSKLWPGQPEVLEQFKKLLQGGKTGFILEAKPGFGKTVTVIAMLELLNQRTLVIVPRSNLIKQWIDRLVKHSNMAESEIGWVEGGKAVWDGKKIVVGLVHSLVLDRYGKDFQRYFGCVVFDEVDRSVPPATFTPAVAMFPAKYRIGATATVKRMDGLDSIFRWHVGQTWLLGKDANRMKPKVLIHKYTESSGYVPGHLSVIQRRGVLLSKLAANVRRNWLLAGYILRIVRSGRRCLVLSDRIQQLVDLKGLLLSKGQKELSEADVGYYVRQLPWKAVKPVERQVVAKSCKVIMASYGMIALGTDIPSLAGLVYATPQSQIEQSKGRIERLLEGKQTPVVVDVVDTAYMDTIRWGDFRLREYKRQGLQIGIR